MAIISRPSKVSSGRTDYEPATVIDSEEVDGDIDLIYADYNGNIKTANIAADAAIAGSKLDLTAFITNVHVATGANINAAKLLDGSVVTAKLANLGVTTGKIAANAVTLRATAEHAAEIVICTNAGGGLAVQDLANPQITAFTTIAACDLYWWFSFAIQNLRGDAAQPYDRDATLGWVFRATGPATVDSNRIVSHWCKLNGTETASQMNGFTTVNGSISLPTTGAYTLKMRFDTVGTAAGDFWDLTINPNLSGIEQTRSILTVAAVYK